MKAHRRRLRPWALLCGIILLSGTSASAAVPPDAVHYQGVLRDDSGTPLDGAHDIVFRLWSAATGGDEILVDRHTAANGNAVDVADGLLSVEIGQGVVADGAGPGAYTGVASVFEDYSDVWLAIEVDGQPLTPRVRIASTGHALNARHAEHAVDAASLGGSPASSFLDTSPSAQTKQGPLRASVLEATDDLVELQGSGATLSHDDPGNDTILQAGTAGWDSLVLRSGNQPDDGQIRIDPNLEMTLTSGSGLFRFEEGNAGSTIALLSGSGDFQIDGDLDAWGGTIDLGGGSTSPRLSRSVNAEVIRLGFEGLGRSAGQLELRETGSVVISSPEHVFFLPDGSGAQLAQLLSDGDLLIGGTLSAATNFAQVGYNRFGDGHADGPEVGGPRDVYVSDDLEVDGTTYLESPVVMNENGGDGKQQIQFFDGGVSNAERFQWDGDPDSERYEFSDDVRVFGGLQADIKNFVQNHPDRDDLQLVYTSLEGDEAAVFTRGSARLENGVARVALGPTFRHVANPDLGVTVHLTPRGEWAELYVARATTEELTVRAAPGAAADAAFDYVVLALRIGYEEFPVIRAKSDEAYLPPTGWFDADLAGDPELREATALARHRAMYANVSGGEPPTEGARALRRAIGERPIGLVYERGSDVAVRDLRPVPESDEARDADPVGRVPAPVAAGADGRVTVTGSSPRSPGPPVAPDPETVRAGTFRSRAPELTRMMMVEGPVEPGDVVVVGSRSGGALRRADAADDPRVVGIVASEPGMVLGAADRGGVERGDPRRAPIAVAGVVTCRVDAEYGAVQAGDLLAASPTPGHAMRSRGALPGTVVAKALEPLLQGRGMVRALVMAR